MIEKTEGRHGFEDAAAAQFHAILGIFRVAIEHLAPNFPDNEACREPPPRKHAPPDAGRGHQHPGGQRVAPAPRPGKHPPGGLWGRDR